MPRDDDNLGLRCKRYDLLECREPLLKGRVICGHVEVVENDGWLVAPQLVDRADAIACRDDVIIFEARAQLAQRARIVIHDQ